MNEKYEKEEKEWVVWAHTPSGIKYVTVAEDGYGETSDETQAHRWKDSLLASIVAERKRGDDGKAFVMGSGIGAGSASEHIPDWSVSQYQKLWERP